MSRFLSETEIEKIISFVKPQKGIPPEFSNSLVEKHKESLRKQLREYEVYPEIIPHLRKEMKRQYLKALIEPGENIGIQAAQNIGREQTQTALDAFHRAGAKENFLVDGNSRFSELLCMTKEPKVTTSKIFFNENTDTIQSLREMIGDSLVELTIKKITQDYLIYDNKEEVMKNIPETKKWYPIYEKLYEDIPENMGCLVYILDKNKMFEYKLDVSNIIAKINDNVPRIICVPSPHNLAQIHIYFEVTRDELEDETDEAIYNHILETSVTNIGNIFIAGIKNIEEMFYLKQGNEWVVETVGSNLLEVLAHPKIDSCRTVSNKVWDIYHLLGIEATREFLLEEFLSIMAEINLCDIQILVDTMTYSGTLSSISRHAMKRDQAGPLGKSCFEESLDNFGKAALYGEHENTRGVTASIICGKVAKVGTGVVDLMYDVSQLNLG